jgi:hypothetical protein
MLLQNWRGFEVNTKKLIISAALIVASLTTGCAIGAVNQTTTLGEPQFAFATMHGSVTDAARCVGRYWQVAASEKGLSWNLSNWNVNTDSYQVRVTGPQLGGGAPPVGLVIQFDERDGKTVAHAHVHHIFSMNDPRRRARRIGGW